MKASTDEHNTFSMLDKEKGIPELPPVTADEYPLPAWYRAVRDVPLRELSPEDLSKANRQQIHPDHVVPTTLALLQSDPLAGDMYDGELLVSLSSVPPEYWSAHADQTEALKSVIGRAIQMDGTTDDVRKDFEDFMTRIGGSVPGGPGGLLPQGSR
jgi:hypothetical protein